MLLFPYFFFSTTFSSYITKEAYSKNNNQRIVKTQSALLLK
jgi:hypothetical protein